MTPRSTTKMQDLPRRTWRRGILRRFSSEQRGSAVVEFALVMPVMISLMLGIFEFSWLFYQRHAMLTAAERGARGVATQTLTATEAVAATEATLAEWDASYSVTITEPDPTNVNDRDVVVVITAPTHDLNITGFFNGFLPPDITVETFMRQEG